jgi:hypothetical protein
MPFLGFGNAVSKAWKCRLFGAKMQTIAIKKLMNRFTESYLPLDENADTLGFPLPNL